jgi:DNA-binding Xre family transcriptional regulator
MGKLRLDGRRLKVLMAMNGIDTLPQLAEQANMHYNSVYKMVNTGRFSIDSIESLANVLGCNPIDLVTTEGYPDPKSVPLVVRGRELATA